MTDRPARDDILMGMARLMATRGTCSRLQVGAVVSRDGRSLVQGYNGAPAGLPHCVHTCKCPVPREPDGNHVMYCPAAGPCKVAVHAEANAITFAAKEGVTLDGSEMFTTHMPCLGCAQLIINAGIMRLAYHTPYRMTDGIDLLLSARVEVSIL